MTTGGQPGRVERPREAGQQRAEDVHENPGTAHRKPHQGGGVAAAAHREDRLAERGALQDQAAHTEEAEGDQHRIAEARHGALPELREGRAVLHEVGRGALVGDVEQKPAGAEQRGEGDDEGRHASAGDEQTVDRPDRPAHGERQQQRGQQPPL
jgi:hypothetical protein